jgi:hypothetical protein
MSNQRRKAFTFVVNTQGECDPQIRISKETKKSYVVKTLEAFPNFHAFAGGDNCHHDLYYSYSPFEMDKVESIKATQEFAAYLRNHGWEQDQHLDDEGAYDDSDFSEMDIFE